MFRCLNMLQRRSSKSGRESLKNGFRLFGHLLENCGKMPDLNMGNTIIQISLTWTPKIRMLEVGLCMTHY
jgi:hypothetical protein